MTHDELIERAVRWLRRSCHCKLVTTYSGAYGEQPDAIGWRHREGSHLVECKVSQSDFHEDLRKPWRWRRGLGLFRWYMTPPGLLRNCKLPACWGLIEVHSRQVRVIRRARQVPLGWWDYQAELWYLVKLSLAKDWKYKQALQAI